jgi:adenylate cyclase
MIDKFLADGIIGVFGVPLEDAAAEEHALTAALDIVRLIDAMDRRWQAQGRRSFRVGIGINSGEVIAGDAGFHDRRVFTVVGPETLFAARLQELTLDLNASVVASATTCNPVRERFSLLPLTGHPLPGLKRLSDAFVVLGLAAESTPLAMPGTSAFRETQVDAAVRGPSAGTPRPSPAVASRVAKRVVRVTPDPPEIAPLVRLESSEALATQRRRAEMAADTAFGLPPPRDVAPVDTPIRAVPPIPLPP